MLTNYLRRVLSFTMALIMVISMVPAQAFATDLEETHEHCETCGQHDCICPPEEDSAPEHVHEYVAGQAVPAGCDSAGFTPYTCTGCGAVENRDVVEALGHAYETQVVEATAEEQGYTEYTCSVCGDTYKDNFTSFETEPEISAAQNYSEEYQAIQDWIDEMLCWYLYGTSNVTDTLLAEIAALTSNEVADKVIAMNVDDLFMAKTEIYDLKAEAEAVLSNEELKALVDNNQVGLWFDAAVSRVAVKANTLADLTVLDGQITISGTALANGNGVEVQDNQIIIRAKATGCKQPQTTKVTIKNTSGSGATISFDYKGGNFDALLGLDKDYTSYSSSASGSVTKTLVLGGSFDVSIESRDNASDGDMDGESGVAKVTLSNIAITLREEKDYNTKFSFDQNAGTVKMDGVALEPDATVSISSNGTTLTAEAKSGFSFFGWVDGETGRVLSTATTYSFAPLKDGDEVKAAFAGAGTTAWFQVCADGKYNPAPYLFDDLGEAAAAYTTLGSQYNLVVPVANGTLGAGEYTIPSGITLLIPSDSNCKIQTTAPSGTYNGPPSTSTPAPYRTLTLAAGAELYVDGTLSVSGGTLYFAGGSRLGSGTPVGTYGYVKMENGSSITVNSGGGLYCYGYINVTNPRYNEKTDVDKLGKVLIKSGAVVYESFLFDDFRGGSQMDLLVEGGAQSGYGVFPINTYSVQNVMVPMTLESGATEYGYAGVTVMSVLAQGTSLKYIAKENAMFNLKGGTVTKRYVHSQDRLEIRFDAEKSTDSVDISSISMQIASYKIDSSKYDLPIYGNMSIYINGGSINMNQDAALLPGVKIYISKDASCNMSEGISMFVYDSDQWGTYCGANNQKMYPVYYVPDRIATLTESNLTDAYFEVAGKVKSSGNVFTTAGGAAIVGVEGATVSVVAADESVAHYQMIQGGDPASQTQFISIDKTPVRLKNGDGSYTDPATINPTVYEVDGTKINPGTTYTYTGGVWVPSCNPVNLNGTMQSGCQYPQSDIPCKERLCLYCGQPDPSVQAPHTPGNDATCETAQTCTACGDVIVAALNHKNGGNAVNAKAVYCYSTEAGHKAYYTCKDCGKPFEDNTCTKPIADLNAWLSGAGKIDIPEHTWNGGVVTTAATCTTEGVKTFTCTVCASAGKTTTKTEPVSATGHLKVNVNQTSQVDATCDQDGVKAYFFCAGCNKYFATGTIDGEKVTLSDEIADLAAWKTGAGKIGKTGHSTDNEKTAAAVPSSCTVNGTAAYWYCTNCETYYSNAACTAKIDDLDAWKAGDGKLALAQHNNDIEVKQENATCVAPGITAGFKCSVCQQVQSGCAEIPQLSHNGIEVPGKAADCTNPGWQDYYRCNQGCGKYYAEEACTTPIEDLDAWKSGSGKIDALDHHLVLIPEVPADCATGTAGFKAYYQCKTAVPCECGECDGRTVFCAKVFEDENGEKPIANLTEWGTIAAAHTPGKPVEENKDEVTGIYESVTYCDVCEKEISRYTVTPGTSVEHTNLVQQPPVEATCYSTGLTAGAYCADGIEKGCPACSQLGKDYVLKQEEIPMKLHSVAFPTIRLTWSDDRTTCTASANCINTGCGKTVTQTVAATKTEKVAATCEKDGYTIYTSEAFTDESFVAAGFSGVKTTKDTVAKLGHDWSGAVTFAWSDDKTTCTATQVCANNTMDSCTRTAAASTVNKVVTAVTCETDGYTTYTANFNETWAKTGLEPLVVAGEKATGHSWRIDGAAHWNMTGDAPVCTADLVCVNNPTHTHKNVAATVEQTGYTPAYCDKPGKITYTATFDEQWKISPVTGEKGIAVLACEWVFAEPQWTWDEEARTYICTLTKTCTKHSTGSHTGTGTQKAVASADTATCTEPGQIIYTATFASEEFGVKTKTVDTAPLGHDLAFVAEVSPTCKTTGTAKHYKCKTCGKLFETDAANNAVAADDLIMPTVGHSYTSYVYNNDASCTKPGTKTASCDFDCGMKSTINDAEHPQLEHTFTSYIYNQDATCQKPGTETAECDTCDSNATHTRNSAEHPQLKHEYKEEVLEAATCTAAGTMQYTCQNGCNHSYTEDIPKLGHDYVQQEGQAATCYAEGWKAYYLCQRDGCGLYFANSGDLVPIQPESWKTGAGKLEKIAHAYESVVTAPTCLEKGYTTHTCKNCPEGTDGHSYVDSYKDALQHKYDSGVILAGDAPTCTDAGKMTFTCQNACCTAETTGHSYTKPVDALGHELVLIDGKAADCDSAGWNACYKCAVRTRSGERSYCGYYFASETDTAATATPIATDASSLATWRATPAGENGGKIEQRVCVDADRDHDCDYDDCDKPMGAHVDENHDHICDTYGTACTKEERIGGACSDVNTDTDHNCDYCGETIDEHTFVNGVCNCAYVQDLSVKITIKAQGQMDHNVPVADIKYGNNGEDFTKALDLTEMFGAPCYTIQSVSAKVGGVKVESKYQGNTLTIAAASLTGDVEIVVDAYQNHQTDAAHIKTTTKAPTCEEDGEEKTVITCKNCGTDYDTQIKVLPAKNHDWEISYVDPTFEADGYTLHHCKNDSAHDYKVIDEGTRLGAVAKIGDTKYQTLEEAIAAAENRQTVKLLAKCVVEGTQVWDKNITIVIPAEEGNYGLVIKGDLTIQDGTFIVNGIYGIGVQPGAKLTINGGVFELERGAANDYLIGSWGEIVINDGEFAGQYNCVNGFAGSLTINGGEFETDEFDATGEYASEDVLAADGVAQVKGGTFSKSVEDYLAEGYCQVKSGSTYEVAAHKPGEPFHENEEDASCETDGSYELVTKCERCDAELSREDKVIPATGHTVEVIAGKDADCLNPGYHQAYHCTVCGGYYANRDTENEKLLSGKIDDLAAWQATGDGKINALGHNLAHVDAVAAACETSGVKEYWQCERCDAAFADAQETVSIENLAQWKAEGGDGYISATGHRYTSNVTVQPTCTEDGIRTFTCQNDNSHTYHEAEPKLNHNYAVTYSWNEDRSACTASAVCENNPNHKATMTAVVTVSVTREADCENAGAGIRTAAFSENTYGIVNQVEDVTIPAKNHSFTNYISDGNTTCTEDGTKTAQCDNGCGKTDTVANTGAAQGHKKQEITAVPATCTNDGIIHHYLCSTCLVRFYDEACQQPIEPGKHIAPALEHEYSSQVTDPDCVNQGYTTYTCIRGDHTYKGNYVDALGHDYTQAGGTVVTAPTCTEEGYTTYTCSRGDESHTGNVVPATGHAYERLEGKSADCTNPGWKAYYQCQNSCGLYYDQVLNQDAQWEYVLIGADEAAVESWKTGAGKIDAYGHTFKDVPRKDCDCDDAGYLKALKCVNCDLYFTENDQGEKVLIGDEAAYTAWISEGGAGYVKPLGHTPGEMTTEHVVAPKCETDGSHDEVIYCTVCTAELNRTEVTDPKLNHNYTAVSGKDRDCVNSGYLAAFKCENCDLYFAEDENGEKSLIGTGSIDDYGAWIREGGAGYLKAKGHNPEKVPAKNPSCTEAGLTEGEKCSDCGNWLKIQTDIPVVPHVHTVSGSIIPATCTVDGSQDLKCANCDDTITKVLKAPGHNSDGVIDAVAPTCTETGLTEGKKCTVCNAPQVPQQEVPATGHLHVTTTEQVDTSCRASGLKAYYFCDDCDTYYATRSEENETVLSDKIGDEKALNAWKSGDGKIEKLPHTNKTIPAVAPTCTADGLKAGVKCSVCDEILVEQAVDPSKGHTEVTDKAKAPTCTETGLTEGKHCAVCPEILVKQDVVPAAGHRSVVKHKQVDAHCLGDGIKEFYYCDDCALYYATRSEENETILSDLIGGPADLANWKRAGGKIEKLPHTIEPLQAQAPTCEEDGLSEGQKCSVCHTVLVPQDKVPSTGHKEVIDNKVDPTCTETGLTEGKHCSACPEILVPQQEVPAKGHTSELVKGLAAKCEADGWKDYYQCKECKNFFEDAESKLPIEDLAQWKVGTGKLPQSGHAWDNGHETTLPTCTTTGIMTYTCDNCNGSKTGVIPELGHDPVPHAAQHPTYYSAGWHAYETCTRCDYNTFVGIAALGEPSVKSFEAFMTSLQYLEGYANDYAKANPGKDPMLLLIKYVRTGVDRYNSGSWNIMAGYEDEAFAEYVKKQEEAYNKAVPSVDDMINVTGIKNISTFKLPNGDKVDFGHMFGTMDITYHNKTSVNHADVGGWAGDLVDLLSTADRHDVTGSVDQMIEEIGKTYLNHSIANESDQFSQTDMYGDLDGYYFMNELIGSDYVPGMFFDMMEAYFVASLNDEQRADYFLKNRLGGVTSRNDIRDAVFREYTGNQVIATLEGTREFKAQDLSDLRKACCYAFADYLCKLAGDYVELGNVSYLKVFSTETSVLAPGITQQISKATTSDDKQVVYYTATGDVMSPYISVYANYKDNNPGGGWGMQRVRDQANAAQEKYGNPESEHYIPNYNVIATINGAGYNMSTGEPSGVLMMGGVEYHAPNGGGFFGIRKDGTACLGSDADYYAMKAKGELSEAIAIFGTTLIKDGKINVFANDFSRASRTAIGYTKTGKVVFMVMDGRQEPVSCGGSMAEIAQVMLEAGCVWAVNLDGGGSTTYLARQEGSDQLSLVNIPSDGFERSVSTSWIMVSTAPSSNTFDHAVLSSDVRHMTIGASVQVTAAGVSATGNSVDLPDGTTWAVSDPSIASISDDGMVTALANGTFDVQLKLGDQVIGSRTMYVVVPDAVYFTKDNMNAVYGEPAELPVAALFEGKPVAITENDAYFQLSNEDAGTTVGYTFIGSDASGIKNVRIFALAVNNPNATSGSMGINLYQADEATFDFDDIDGGDRLLAWKRVVTNSTTVDKVTYTVEDSTKPMVTEYTFGMDMTQIPMPEKLTDLVFMLPGADVEGNNSAWDFLLQLAERVSTLTEVKAVIDIDPDFDVDYSELSVNCEYFNLEKVELNSVTNQLILSLRWKDQTKAIDPDIANPLVILAGIKLTPKSDAAWNSKDQLEAIHSGNISYDIYLRANALYSFASKPENQEAYDLYPFSNPDVLINGAPESGGHFADTYKEFSDSYTLNKGMKNGWVFEDGGYAYYENGEKYLGIRKAGTYYYDFGTNGINIGQTKYTGIFQIDGINHYAKDGTLSEGWYTDGDDRYYFDQNGKAVDGEIILDEVRMVFDNGLHVGGHSGFLKKNNGKTYYYRDGNMTYGWVEVGDDLYHFNTDNGAMTTGTHVIPDDEARAKGAYYDFADDGRTLRGYFNPSGYYYWAGLPKRDAWVKEGSDPDPDAWYHTNNTGHFVTSSGRESYKLELNGVTYDAVKIPYDGVVYVFDDHSGKLLLGAMKYEDGFWYHIWAGEPVNDGWFEFEGETYYAFEDGKLAAGVHNIDGKIYMFTEQGALVKDGIKLNIALSDDATKLTIQTNQIDSDMARVIMAVWSDENGQDDLQWIEATGKDGVWTVEIDPLCCSYSSTGRYYIHAYEYDETGTQGDILVTTIYDLAEIGHRLNAPVKLNVVAPTCQKDGGYDLVTTCEGCKQIIKSEHVVDPASPKAHVYDDIVDGTCNVCSVDRAEVAVRKKYNMFRMYNPYTMEHFYTGSEVERDNLVAVGWRYEGIAFTFPANMGAPVHRLYDPATGEHLYTMSEEEKTDLMAKGWNYEGVAFNSGFDTEAVQHRLHNPYETVGSYHFTYSQEEMNNLIAAGWIYQGIGWYSCFK